MSGWRIRAGAPHDIPCLGDVERASDTLFPPGRLPPGDATYPIEELQAACDEGLLFVAESAGRIAGFAFCAIADGRLHLTGLAVHPDFGRRGIGAALLRRVIGEATTRGLSGVSLTTFADLGWNAPFYARFGFSVAEDRALSPFLATMLASERVAGMRERVVMILPLRRDGAPELGASR